MRSRFKDSLIGSMFLIFRVSIFIGKRTPGVLRFSNFCLPFCITIFWRMFVSCVVFSVGVGLSHLPFIFFLKRTLCVLFGFEFGWRISGIEGISEQRNSFATFLVWNSIYSPSIILFIVLTQCSQCKRFS